jgi:GTPase involved in cell partitioning and DNA repair
MMEELLKQLLESNIEIKNQLIQIDKNVKILEHRLDRLEKVDSIEHRVMVNQIDLTDIKEIVEKMDSFQREEMKDFLEIIKETTLKQMLTEEITQIHQRLDAQLTKIGKNEEAILMMEGKTSSKAV